MNSLIKIAALLLLALGLAGLSAKPADVGAKKASPIAIKTRIETGKFAETRAFYIDILRLEVIEEWDEGDDKGCILGFSANGSSGFLEIGWRETPVTGLEALSLQFQVTDIEAFAKSLAGKWPFEGPLARPWGSVYIYLEDPNGISVIVFEGDI